MYTINSKTDACYVVTFLTKEHYEKIANKLKEQYNFTANKNNSATIANTMVESCKVTLTLFNSQKLMIQGAGSKDWVATVFKQVSSELVPDSQSGNKVISQESENEKTPNRKATTVVPQTLKFGPFPPKVSKSNSPLNFLNKLFGGSNVSGSPANYSQGELQTSPIFNRKSKKQYNVPENYKDIEPKPQTGKAIIVDNETACKQVDEETHCKQSYQDEPIVTETSISIDSKITEETTSKSIDGAPLARTFSETSDQNVESVSEVTQNHENCPYQNLAQDIESCKSAISSLQQENGDLHAKLKELVDYSKKMKNENEKLFSTAVANEEENKTLKIKLETAITTAKKQETEIKSLKAKLSEETTSSLLLEEENKKLKIMNDKLSKEKATILGQVINSTGLSDTIESKIENEMQYLKDDMNDLKDNVFEAINGLRNQIEKSMTVTRLHHNQNNTESTQSAETHESIETTATANANETQNQHPLERTDSYQQSTDSRTFRALILGDSVTRILSSKRLSDKDLIVKIKSHSGGRLQDLHNSVTRMAETDEEIICTADVILLHCGTNNLSDGDSEGSVTEQLERITAIIEDVNPFCKIVISSILPHKNDRLGNLLIKQTNQSLEQLCTTKEYCFMENTPRLMANGAPDPTVYRDNIHLNAKGGKGFGEAISHRIRDLLKLPALTSSVQEQGFQSGRLPGRRLTKKRNNRNNNSNNQNNSNNNNNNANNRGSNNNTNNRRSNNNANTRGNNNNADNWGNNNNANNSGNNNNAYNRGSNNNNANNRGNNNNANANNLGNNNNANNCGNNNNADNNYNLNNNSSQPWMNNNSPMMYMPMPFFQPPWFTHNQTMSQ